MRRVFATVLAIVALISVSAHAQKAPKEPKRPNLAGADTNDASAYYTWGARKLEENASDAADAFYWSTRLNPTSADNYYARWAALLLSDLDRLVQYQEGNRKTVYSPEVRQIDSLRLRASGLNPYFYRRFERIMLRHAVEQSVLRNEPGMDQAQIAEAVRDYMSKGSLETRAMNAYATGNFPAALQYWASAMSAFKYKSFVHGERGRIFYMIGAYDSAASELTNAVSEVRKYDKDDVVYFYNSKAVYEQSLALIAERQGHTDAARELYGRALEEDLSYAPAHVALAAMALAKHDTAVALSEMETASQVQPNDGYLAFQYGVLLVQSQKAAEALAQLKRAVDLEPYYSAPRWVIALMYDASDMKEEAVAAYGDFLARASQRDPGIAKAKERIAALSAPAAPAPAPAPAPVKP